MTEIESLISKAQRSLDAARYMYERGFFDFCVSRAYYAMFYIASAALLSRGLRFRRHGAVVAGFGQHFIRPGVLPARLQESFAEAFEQRTRGDYRVLEEVGADEAEQLLRKADDFVSMVRDYLDKESQR